jgi:hypothetical protein
MNLKKDSLVFMILLYLGMRKFTALAFISIAYKTLSTMRFCHPNNKVNFDIYYWEIGLNNHWQQWVWWYLEVIVDSNGVRALYIAQD